MSAPRFASPPQPFRTTVPISMAVMGAVAMHPGVAKRWDAALGSKLSSDKVKAIWWATIGLHILEARSAAKLATAHDMPVGRWVAQTMAYGVFSLSVQRRVARDLDSAS